MLDLKQVQIRTILGQLEKGDREYMSHFLEMLTHNILARADEGHCSLLIQYDDKENIDSFYKILKLSLPNFEVNKVMDGDCEYYIRWDRL